MGIFSFWGRGKRDGDLGGALAGLSPCDSGREPILAFLRRHMRQDGTLPASDHELPDEEPASSGIRWAPGAMDGVGVSYTSEFQSRVIAQRICGALEALDRSPDLARARVVYGYLTESSALGAVDELLQRLARDWPVAPQRLRQIALWLLERSVDRDPVKIGLALLGVSGSDADRELLTLVGAHEEFTLFAAVALQHSAADVEESLWTLSKRVSGWGRVHTVQRLGGAKRPEIRRWLLTDGCRDGVFAEYTALTCATAGALLGALSAERSTEDRPLMDGAGIIIRALLSDSGPADGLNAYSDGPAVVSLYVERVAGASGRSLEQLETLVAIRDFLGGPPERWSRGFLAKWSARSRESLRTQCVELIRLPAWRGLIDEGLKAADPALFGAAAQLAEHVGIDAWEHRFQRLVRGEDQWYWLMLSDDLARVRRVISVAESTLPLDRLSGPPSLQILPSGPDAPQHHAIDWLVSALRRFPGEGWPLVRAAIRSPFTRARNMAAAALEAWPREYWPPDAPAVLDSACRREPDPKLRDKLTSLASGA